MISKRPIVFLAAACLSLGITTARADEGMWLPLLLKQPNESDMQQKGMKLSADDIYSINQSSLKDAIVQFGGQNLIWPEIRQDLATCCLLLINLPAPATWLKR